MSVRLFIAAMRLELKLQLRNPSTLFVLFGTALLMGPGGILIMGAWSQAADSAMEQVAAGERLPIAADAEAASWLIPSDELDVIAEGVLTDDTTLEPNEVYLTAEVVENTLRMRRPLRVMAAATAQRRFEVALDRENDRRRAKELARVQIDPSAYTFAVEIRERSSLTRNGDRVGAVLPMVLVFLLLSAALYGAIDTLTGEKEKGTAETLLCSVTPRTTLLLAKAATVAAVAVSCGWIWALSLFAGQALGLFEGSDLIGDSRVFTGMTTLQIGAIVVLLAAQLTGVSMVVAAWAPNYRQASIAAVPVMLAVVAPAGIAAVPDIQLTPLLALVPIANLSVALRATLAGELTVPWALAVGAATLAHAAGALGVAGWMLARMDPFDKGVDAETRRAGGRFGPDAFGLFAATLVGVYFFGLLAQAQDLLGGMIFTQIVVIGGVALGGMFFVGAPRQVLSLRRPSWRNLLLGGAVGIGLPHFATSITILISPVLQMPDSTQDGLAALSQYPLPLALFAFAVLPGLCEEFLFRGAVLGLLRTSVSDRVAVLLTAAMFGALHLDPTRIVLTGSMGVLLGVLVVRSRSLWPAVIAHALSNATALTLTSASPDPLPLALTSALAIGCVAALISVRAPETS